MLSPGTMFDKRNGDVTTSDSITSRQQKTSANGVERPAPSLVLCDQVDAQRHCCLAEPQVKRADR